MTLQEFIDTECTGMNDEEALAHIKASVIVVDGLADSGKVLAYIAGIGKIAVLRVLAEDDTSPLYGAAYAAIVSLENSSGFDFTAQSVLDLLVAFVAGGILDQAEADHIRALGQSTVSTYPGIRMAELVGLRA